MPDASHPPLATQRCEEARHAALRCLGVRLSLELERWAGTSERRDAARDRPSGRAPRVRTLPGSRRGPLRHNRATRPWRSRTRRARARAQARKAARRSSVSPAGRSAGAGSTVGSRRDGGFPARVKRRRAPVPSGERTRPTRTTSDARPLSSDSFSAIQRPSSPMLSTEVTLSHRRSARNSGTRSIAARHGATLPEAPRRRFAPCGRSSGPRRGGRAVEGSGLERQLGKRMDSVASTTGWYEVRPVRCKRI